MKAKGHREGEGSPIRRKVNGCQEGEGSPIRRKANALSRFEGRRTIVEKVKGRRFERKRMPFIDSKEGKWSLGRQTVAGLKEGEGLPVQRNAKGHQIQRKANGHREGEGSPVRFGVGIGVFLCDGELKRRR